MALYDYLCNSCKKTEEITHGMMENPEIKCSACGALMEKQISRNFGGFTIKGGTPAIHYREKENRRKRSQEMAQRQKERYGEPSKVIPNIAGHETGTWAQAHAIAEEIKKDTGIFPETYAPLAAEESKSKIIMP